ncbi:MAG: ABC transporter ATP-binding protein [Lachnospiraceae bacterium]|nr:ABC transporter ATP-binding protein [Lachnospiraceae bacterium]
MFINRHLISFVSGHGHRIIGTCVLQLILTMLATLVSLCTAFVVRMIQGETRILFFRQVWQVLLTIALLIGVRFILAKIKTIASEKCSLEIKQSLRKELLEKLFALGPAYTGKARTGNTASTITTKVEYLNEYYTVYLPTAAASLFNVVALIAVLSKFNAATAVICTIACAGIYVCPMLFYYLMRKRGEEEMQAHSEYYSDCLDSIQGISTLKAFNANGRQREIIHEKGEKLRQAVMGQLRITMLENVVLQFFAGLGSAFSIAVAAYECSIGNMESENLVYALFLIGACFAPMGSLINAWHFGYRGVVASYSIIELLEEPVKLSLSPKDTHATERNLKTPFIGDIAFHDVSFSYESEEGTVLDNVSFKIPFRTTTALVGVSGSGKSTIAHLLAGFYPVDKGTITVGGKSLTKETVFNIQDDISAVWQDCRLFYGTVEENIRIGKPTASHKEVEEAAKNASIHDFIVSLPDGYQTLIGEQGMRFSGGERQRIAIARAFLRNSPILILDEATSSLDRHNEMEIQHSLHKLSAGKTCLVIAHRLATIQAADQIIIMNKGRIVEKGTHEQLLRSSENYRILMGSQITGGTAYEA